MPSPLFAPPSKWRLRRWWGRFPRWFRAAALLVVAASLAAGGYYWFVKRPATAQRQEVAAKWDEFGKAARAMDEDAMRRTLAELDHLQPDDPLVRRRRQALDEGDADPTDPNMCHVTVLRHAKAKQWAEAEREAEKRLGHEPNDWLCRCAKVAAAFARNDRAAADKLLAELPDPASRGANVYPSGIVFAAELYRDVGRDPAPVRNYLRTVIVDRLRSLVADNDPPATTALLLKCYLLAFHPTEPNPPTLALAVADIGRLIGTATTTAAAANDVPTLIQLGQACEGLFAAFDLLRRDGAMTAEQHAAVTKEHQERTRAVWQAVRDRAPKEAQAHLGLANAFRRDGAVGKATDTAVAGLAAAGDDPRLHALLALLLRDQPELAFNTVADAANKAPDNLPLQLVAAEAAVTAGRYDQALIACRLVYQKDPRNPFAARLEAAAYLRTGDPHKAMQVLDERVGADRLCEDATLANWYVRSRLGAVGVGLEPFLKKCEDAAVRTRNPRLMAFALAGINEAKFDPEWAAVAERTASRWLDQWPGDQDLMRVRAAALARAAERSSPPWAESRVRPAVAAFTELKLKAGDDADTAAALAWLRLKGEKDVPRAMADAAVLIAADDRREPLSVRQLEVLGAVYLAAGKLDPAVRVLETVARSAPTPTARIHLAQAYLKRGRVAEARAVLNQASVARTDWTDQDDLDYRLAVEALQKETR